MSGAPSPQPKPVTSNKWGDLAIRVGSSLVLVAFQVLVILSGYVAISIEMLVIGYGAFREFLNVKRSDQVRCFYMSVFPYLLFTLAIYAFGAPVYGVNLQIPSVFLDNHALFCFSVGCLLMMLFVLNLKENNADAFQRLGWTIIACIILALPAVMYGQIARLSIAWFFMCICFIVLNDTGAYFAGRLFGRHQLIALSPKKTVEGFVGALIICVIAGFFIPVLFARAPFAYCSGVKPFDFSVQCEVPSAFVKKEYFGGKLVCYPAQIHGVVLALFASLVAPFGGFLASGVKRTFGLKDFGTLIPGHGGVLDRVDCQLVMGAFALLYLKTTL